MSYTNPEKFIPDSVNAPLLLHSVFISTLPIKFRLSSDSYDRLQTVTIITIIINEHELLQS